MTSTSWLSFWVELTSLVVWFLWLPNLNTNLMHEIYLNWNCFGFSVEGSGRKNAIFRPGSSSNFILIIRFGHKAEYQKCLLSEITPIQKSYKIFFFASLPAQLKLPCWTRLNRMKIIRRMIYSSPTRNFFKFSQTYSVHITIRYRKGI